MYNQTSDCQSQLGKEMTLILLDVMHLGALYYINKKLSVVA